MIEITKAVNGFLVYPGEQDEPIVVEGTNPRTVAAKLGRVVIKALFDQEAEEKAEEKEGVPDVE